jgi:hypothetical protein
MMNLCNVRALSAVLVTLSLLMLTRHADAYISMSDAKQIAAFPLTVDNMQKMYRIMAELARMTVANENEQELKKDEERSLDEKVHTLQATTNVANVCRANGLSVRDYVLATLAVNIALMPTNDPTYRAGVPRKPDDPVDVAAPPEHVRFVQAHLTEIQKGMEEVDAASEAAAGGGK